MIKIKVSEIRYNADQTEGLGPMLHKAYFKHREDANRVATSVWEDIVDIELRIFDTIDEYKQDDEIRRVKRYVQALRIVDNA